MARTRASWNSGVVAAKAGGGAGRASGACWLGRRRRGGGRALLPALPGPVGQRAERRGTAIADHAAGHLADLLAAEQQREQPAGRGTARQHARIAAQRAARALREVARAGGGVRAKEAVEKGFRVHAPQVGPPGARFKSRSYFPPSTLNTCPLT